MIYTFNVTIINSIEISKQEAIHKGRFKIFESREKNQCQKQLYSPDVVWEE